MKIAGKSITSFTKSVKIRDDLNITVGPIPIALGRDFNAIVKQPQPPVVVTNSVKDGRREEVKWNDPKFLEESAEYDFLKSMYTIWRIIRVDSGISFENDPKDIDSMRALANEIKTSGLHEGDIKTIIESALSISGLTDEKVKEAKESF